MDLSAIVSRLQQRLTGLREIESALGLDAAMRSNLAAPAVYAIPLAEKAVQLEHTGLADHTEKRLFGVIYVVATNDPRGKAAALDLAGLRHQVKNALVGWVPDDTNGEPVLFVGGELLQFEGDGRLWWSDEFLLTGYFRSNP